MSAPASSAAAPPPPPAPVPINSARTEASAVANIVQRLSKPQTLDVLPPSGGAQLLLVPEGFTAESIKPFIDEYLTAPRRRKGTAQLASLKSFIDHVKRFKDENSAIFADRTDPAKPSLTCVLDYHCSGGIEKAQARFGEHRAVYAFPLSDEWNEWKARDGKPFTQAEFAEFIELRLGDVLPPELAGPAAEEFRDRLGATFTNATKLLELSRGLEVHTASRLKQAVKLESGESQMIYVEEHQGAAGATLKVPSAFVIAIPVFRNGAGYQLPVRLRYRARGAELSWFYELYRDEVVFDHAFQEACDDAQRETELPLFMGKPE
jgi:hypothetical protein